MNEELYHHGVKGMKWGVRRYQNADGSYTNAGKKRYVTTRQANKNAKAAANQARKDSIAADKAKGGVRFYKANRNAKMAAAKARKESFAKDKQYNKDLRAEKVNNAKNNAKDLANRVKNRNITDQDKRKAIVVGGSVAAGVALKTVGTAGVFGLTMNPFAAVAAGNALGVVGGMKFYEHHKEYI